MTPQLPPAAQYALYTLESTFPRERISANISGSDAPCNNFNSKSIENRTIISIPKGTENKTKILRMVIKLE